jgi:hypothetical protein
MSFLIKFFITLLLAGAGIAAFAQTDRADIPDSVFIVNNVVNGTANAVSATAALPTNVKRRYLLIQNVGANDLYVSTETFSNTADAIKIIPGGNYEPWLAIQNPIFLRTSTGTTNYVILEGQ